MGSTYIELISPVHASGLLIDLGMDRHVRIPLGGWWLGRGLWIGRERPFTLYVKKSVAQTRWGKQSRYKAGNPMGWSGNVVTMGSSAHLDAESINGLYH